MLKIPSHILVQIEDSSWLNLDATDPLNWQKNGVEIKLCNYNKRSFTLHIHSKTKKLRRIQLSWHNYFPTETAFFGDSFERNYGDSAFFNQNPDRVMHWYFAAKLGSNTDCFGIKTQANSLCTWQVADTTIDCLLDIRNGSQALDLSKRTLEAATIVQLNEVTIDSYDTVKKFCKLLHPGALKEIGPIIGGNDWYYSYGDNSEQTILKQAKLIASLSQALPVKPFMVIDDGWQVNHKTGFNGGPWHTSNKKFSNMKKMADLISELGVEPGLWFRPLLREDREIVTFTKECVLHEDIPNKIVLDPSHPGVLEIIRKDIKTFLKWGYRMIKHDFTTYDIFGSWGVEMGADYGNKEISFHNKDLTTAEIINNFYRMIQKETGEALVIGCNTISHLSAGIFELQRTGDDTSGVDFSRTRQMGVNTMAFRMPQHKVFYLSDVDCVGITQSIRWSENREWCYLLAESGTPLFISCNPDELTDEIKADLKEAFRLAVMTTEEAKPLDWEYKRYPTDWQTENGLRSYDWYSAPRQFDFN